MSNLNLATNGEDAVVSEVRVRLSKATSVNKGSITQSRSYTTFDASNPEHRQQYAFFLSHARWDDNAPRFYVEHPHISAPAMINSKMLEYYISQDQALTCYQKTKSN